MKRALLAVLMAAPAHAEDLPAGFVRLSDMAPQIAQDIRYARDFNFTGAVVPGYEAAACILTAHTAAAVVRVEARLAQDGLGLVVYDCYRPERAVAHFADWAAQAEGFVSEQTLSPAQVFYPGLARTDLIPAGYIARRSGHSVGHTIDVGLRRAGAAVPWPEFSSAKVCDAAQDPADPAVGSLPDMGTTFDCFSPLSAGDAEVPAAAQEYRRTLARAMAAEGFKGYAKEWWHFRNASDPATQAQDFVITAP